ncbi:MAG: arginine--tRNA ligase [Chloroflexi bacterium]|nr:MAG: arginine--tRNA ligase [Chloroflexota bacterium]
MSSLKEQLTSVVASTFVSCGYDPQYGEVMHSSRPDLAQFQCNGALAAAKAYHTTPRQVAQTVLERLAASPIFATVAVAGPGFINLTLTDDYLATYLRDLIADEHLGYEQAGRRLKIIVDYGGANVAKPMHVGHLRAAIIGESLKRLARFAGHEVLGDVHLGDWGLPMGMIIAELARLHPDWPYFTPAETGPFPAEPPVTIEELAEIYPAAARRANEDATAMEAARQATFELQRGRPGYRALWQHFVSVSVAELRRDYQDLNVDFDLWLGESDTQARIDPLIKRLCDAGYARESQGALVVDVTQPGDARELPPFILVKSDGAVLYGTTDLATIEQRVQALGTHLILYVVDKRQSTHFEQLFRAAYKTGVAPAGVELEHIDFGTMNGKDGKPFKTREGGVLRLRTLIEMLTAKAHERLAEIEAAQAYSDEEKNEIARKVGVATLKFADLANHRSIDYVFDLERFSVFEGRTGPYLLYTAVRARSVLRKADAERLAPGRLSAPVDATERNLLLKLAELPDMINLAFTQRAPNHLCEYAYTLATMFNRFYHQHHILSEKNIEQQASWLSVVQYTARVLEQVLDLLGIDVPERM